MTKPVENSNQSLQTLPENIRELIEVYWETITSVHYCGELFIEDFGKVVRAPTFVVNKTHYVYVLDAVQGTYQFESIISRYKRQKEFGRDARRLMDEYDFPWELCKVIIKAYPSENTARKNLCKKIQEVKKAISNDQWGWKTLFANEPKKAMLSVIYWYDLPFLLNTRNHKVYNALKDYWFAVN